MEDAMRTKLNILILPFVALACGDDATDTGLILTGAEQQLLGEMRASVPNTATFEASTPEASTDAVGDARYPHMAKELVHGVNGHVRNIITLLRAIVDHEPTIYNSETEEFIWGPWDNDDPGQFGTVAAYIRKNPLEEDGSAPEFEYSYALLRGVGRDVSTMTPVIWGVAEPDEDNEENGAGITIWDMEANRKFIADNIETAREDDDFNEDERLPHGRFVAVYGAGDGDDNVGDRFGFVYAVMRGFADPDSDDYQDQIDNGGVDIEYLFGHYVSPSQSLDAKFLEFDAAINTDDNPDEKEGVHARMVFLNDGIGRAQVSMVPGEGNHDLEAVECWDSLLETRYLLVEAVNKSDDTDRVTIDNEEWPQIGEVSDCGSVFANRIEDLEIMSFEDMNQDDRNGLKCVGDHGWDPVACPNL
jgi:hypothetical protein